MEVAATLRDARRREDVLRARLEDLERTDRRQPVAPLDEESLTAALGEEDGPCVAKRSRGRSREIAAKAEQRANALIADAESALAERSRYAEAEAEALLARARAEATAYLESTKEQARAMVQEARDARRRILTDLAERRRAMQLQLEQLRAGKETLSEILDGVSGSILSAMDTVRARLERAEQDARVSASAAMPGGGTIETFVSMMLPSSPSRHLVPSFERRCPASRRGSPVRPGETVASSPSRTPRARRLRESTSSSLGFERVASSRSPRPGRRWRRSSGRSTPRCRLRSPS